MDRRRAVAVGAGAAPVPDAQGGVVSDGRALSTSVMLREFAATLTTDRVTLGDVVAVMRDRAFGIIMAIFALANTFPSLPGMSSILGAPLVLLSAQMMIGQARPWIPGFMARRSFSTSDFRIFTARALPILERAERRLRPRLLRLTSPMGERVIGGFCFLLSVILVLPIFGGNLLPAIAILLLSLALIERDGLAAILGYIVGVVALAVVITVLVVAIVGSLYVVDAVFDDGAPDTDPTDSH